MKYKHPAPPIYSNSLRSIPAIHYVIIHNDYNETVNYTTIQTLLFMFSNVVYNTFNSEQYGC